MDRRPGAATAGRVRDRRTSWGRGRGRARPGLAWAWRTRSWHAVASPRGLPASPGRAPAGTGLLDATRGAARDHRRLDHRDRGGLQRRVELRTSFGLDTDRFAHA